MMPNARMATMRMPALSLSAMALLAALAMAAPPLAHAQPADPTAEPVCAPLPPSPQASDEWAEMFLKPGESFSPARLSPAVRQQAGAWMAEEQKRKSQDWPYLCRYAADNARLVASGQRPHVVFMGDSITENWVKGDPVLLGGGNAGRGISGQTTPQMLLRFYPDVIALHPRVVHIMAGTNDISGNTGPTTDRTIVDNLRAMIVLAKANRIKVVLGSITPSSGFTMRPGANPATRIMRVNGLLRQLAAEQGVTFADYHAPMADAQGGLRAGLANDGLHPNRDGYAVMRPVTQKAIAQAER
ncbi:GDSL-type esterase/lipase family protein [Sphingobium sufflavum]|uniref:GDSL-type esterase/lipase family protein n=1 Tax=Sphingobium sufflavum TaxID=1129547 RepID=UPI001F2FF485|nr:GDSL-type esterase/lipase family protein [Sphingobium sufflavum]MCE7796219.1 GDSL-type esterase/lipase family protein [Sphingobium sufflavum]